MQPTCLKPAIIFLDASGGAQQEVAVTSTGVGSVAFR